MTCRECGMPTPRNGGTLHLEKCNKHDINTCLACKELIDREEYKELERIKQSKGLTD